MATVAHVVNPSLQPKLPYNHEKAFTPVMLVGVSPNVLVVRDSSPFKSVKDVIGRQGLPRQAVLCLARGRHLRPPGR